MAKYRHIRVLYPDGKETRAVVEDMDVNPELMRLQLLYGAKIKKGRLMTSAEAARWDKLLAQRIAYRKEARPARLLSPDFGRGSGGPV